MSLCRTRNLDENDHQDNQVNNYIKMKENSDENMNNVKEKKKKISIPKDTIYKEDEEIKKKENKKEEKVEIINTDIPKDLKNKKPEEKINFNMDEMDSTKEILKENEKKENKEKINNEELIQNKSDQEKKKEIQNINNDKKINEEHIENDEKKEIKEDKIENKEEIIKEDDNNKNDLQENIKEENINKAKEEKVELEKENTNANNDIMNNEEKEVLRNVPKKIENEPEIQKEEIKPESEKNKDEINNKEAEEKKEEILEEPKEEIKKEEKPIENKEENNEEKDEIENNEEQEQIQDENNNNNEVKEEQEENKELNTKEEKENEINEEKNLEIKSPEEKKDFLNNQANTDNQSFNDFLTKNDSLIKVININLESKGYSKTDIQSKIDEVFQSISESKLDQNHISSISTPLYDLLTITVESDKKDLDKFFNELFSSLNYDKEKIHEQLLTFAEDIEEQEKLKTRKLNRSIRSCIKECQDILNKLFKQDDMPSDRVVTYDKFNQIVEDVGIKMKKEYMDVLLYQMKMAVPKGRSIYEFNMIVIVDFLK